MTTTLVTVPPDGGQQNEALRRAAGRPLRAPSYGSDCGSNGSTNRGPLVGHQLLAIADHLTAHRPTAAMTEAARMTLALHAGGTAEASRPLLAALPWPTRAITRGEYALRLRQIAHAAGHQTGSER